MFLQNNNTAYLIYNDGVPKSVNYSRKYGHTKGMTKAFNVSFQAISQTWWVGDEEVIVLIVKALCYAMKSLLILNLHRKVCSFGKLG